MRRANSSSTVSSAHQPDPTESTVLLSSSVPADNSKLFRHTTNNSSILPLPLSGAHSSHTPHITSKAARVARRMQNKASAARASRRRKKAYNELLNERVSKLQYKLNALQNNTIYDSVDANDIGEMEYMDTQAQLIFKLQQLMSNHTNQIDPQPHHNTVDGLFTTGVDDSNLLNNSQLLHDVCVQYIRLIYSRLSSIDSLFYDIEPKLIPSMTLKFILWMLSQPNEFYDLTNAAASVQWTQFTQKFQLTTTQCNELLLLRPRISDLMKSIQQSHAQLFKSRQYLYSHVESRRSNLQQIQSILTPEQMSEFILYADTQLITNNNDNTMNNNSNNTLHNNSAET